MKYFINKRLKMMIFFILALLFAVTGFFAVSAFTEKDENIVAYAADSSPTKEQLASIGYSIEGGYQVQNTSTGSATIMFDGANRTFPAGTTNVNILVQTVGGVKYHLMFFTANVDVPTARRLSPTDPSNNPHYNYIGIHSAWTGQLTFASPQSLSSLKVDSAGRIYYPYKDHNGRTATYYLGSGGFTTSTSGVPSVVQKAAAPTGKTLTYSGSPQLGVASGTGYKLGGTYMATNVGTYYASATLETGYVWSDGSSSAKLITWKINALALSQSSVSIAAGNAQYSPDGAIPSYVHVAYGSNVLKEGTDYTVSYYGNTGEAGSTATVGVTFKGNYSGAALGSYNIIKSDCPITVPGTVKVSALDGETALNVTTDSTGEITYQSSDAEIVTIASVSESGDCATLTGGSKLGTAEVTVTVAESANYNAGETKVQITNLLENGFYIVKDGEKYAYSDINEAYAALGDADRTIYVVGNPVVSEPLVVRAGESVAIAAGEDSASITGANDAVLSRADGFTGSIFSVESGGALSVAGLTLDGKNVSGDSLIASAGNLTISGGAAITNGNSENGGAVYVSGGSLDISGSATFADNTATYGGAVYVASGASLTVGAGASFTRNTAENGGAIYVAGGASLTVGEGSSFTANKVNGNGGAIYIEKGAADVAVNGGTIKNNSADGTGDGIYIEDTVQLSVAGNAAGVTDGIGIEGAAQIRLTGSEVTGDFTVDFATPDSQLAGTVPNNKYLIDYENSTPYVVAENESISNGTLNSHVGVQNSGYVFDYDKPTGEEGDVLVSGLFLKKSIVNVVAYIESDNTITYFSSIKEAIAHVKAVGNKDENGISTGTLYFLQHETENDDGSKSYSHIEISLPMTVLDGVNITYESAVMIPTGEKDEYGVAKEAIVLPDADGKLLDADGNAYAPTVIMRAQSLTAALLTVEEGGTLTLGNVTLDGGAEWDGGSIQIKDDGKGGAGTVTTNNTGITAHAPVIVNQGTLIIGEGATVQNNDNNYAAPGLGFGSQNYGGGVRNEGAGELTMTGGAIRDCYSREGGAIMNVNKLGTDGYEENGNPSVTVSGGTISGNVSQQKGAAIQTIYGGATTTVTGEAEITGNWSLNDLGTLSVEEGGALTVSGGTVSAVTAEDNVTDLNDNAVENQNVIYLYNKYSAEDYGNASTKPFIEGAGGGDLTVTGAPELSGSVHIDGACKVVNSEDKYYEPFIDVAGYTGAAISVDLSEGAVYGKIAENIGGDFTKISLDGDAFSENLSALFTYSAPQKDENGAPVTDENGNPVYALYTSGYALAIDQIKPGILEISGVCDTAIQSITITVDGKPYIISKDGGAIDENGNVRFELDLGDLTGSDFTASVEAQFDGGVSVTTEREVALKVVKFDAETGVVTAPEGAVYVDTDGQRKPLATGLLPNDIAIGEDGNITVIVDGEERVIHIGPRADEIEENVVTTLYDISDTTIHIQVEEQFRDYEYNLVYTDADGNEVFVSENWITPDGADGDIIFNNLLAGGTYTVVVRNPAVADGEGQIVRIPGVYKKCVDSTYQTSVFQTLTAEQMQSKKAFEDAYAGIEGRLLVETDDGQVIAEPDATTTEIKAVIDLYDELIEEAKIIPAINIKIARLHESYDHALANEWLDNHDETIKAVQNADEGEDLSSYKESITAALAEYEADDFTDGARELVKEEYDLLVDAYRDVIVAELHDYIDTAVEKGGDREEVSAIIDGYVAEINADDAQAGIYQLAERAKIAADLRAEYDTILARNKEYSAEGAGMTENSLTELNAALSSGLMVIHNIEASDTLNTDQLLAIVFGNAVTSMRNIEADGVVQSYYASIAEGYEENGITSEEAKKDIEDVYNEIVGENGKIETTEGVDQLDVDAIIGRISSYLLELDKAEGKAILRDYLDYGDGNSAGDAEDIRALVTGDGAANDKIDAISIPDGAISAKGNIAEIVVATKVAIEIERAKDAVEAEYDGIAARITALGGDEQSLTRVKAILNEYTAAENSVIGGAENSEQAWLEAARAIVLMQVEGERAAIEVELKKLGDLNAAEKMDGRAEDENDGGVNGILDEAVFNLKAAATSEDFDRIIEQAFEIAATYLEQFDREKFTADYEQLLEKAKEIVKDDGTYGVFGADDDLSAIITDVDGALADLAGNYLASSQEKMDDLRDLLLDLKKAALIARLQDEYNGAGSAILDAVGGYIAEIKAVDIAGGAEEGATAAADAIANRQLDLIALKAVAAADYLESYKEIYGGEADITESTVAAALDNIHGASDLAEINRALGDGVSDLLDGMLLAGDSDETVALVEGVKAEVENAVAAANAAESVADLSEVVNTIKAAVDKQRGDEKAAAKELIDGDADIAAIKEALSEEAIHEAENLIDAAKAEIDGGEYDDYPAIIAKLRTKLAVLEIYDDVLSDNADSISEGGKTELRTLLDDVYREIDGAEAEESGNLADVLADIAADAEYGMTEIKARELIEEHYNNILANYAELGISSPDTDDLQNIYDQAIAAVDSASSVEELNGIVEDYKLLLDKEEAITVLQNYVKDDTEEIQALIGTEAGDGTQASGAIDGILSAGTKQEIDRIVADTKLDVEKARAKDAVNAALDAYSSSDKIIGEAQGYTAQGGTIDSQTTVDGVWAKANRMIAVIEAEHVRDELYSEIEADPTDKNAQAKKQAIDEILDGAISSIDSKAETDVDGVPAGDPAAFIGLAEEAIDKATERLAAFDRDKFVLENKAILDKALAGITADDLAAIDAALDDLAGNYILPSQDDMDDLRDQLLSKKKAALVSAIETEKGVDGAVNGVLDHYIDLIDGQPVDGDTAADGKVNENLDLLNLKAIAAKDYLESYKEIYGDEADITESTVAVALGNIQGASDLAEINRALGGGVSDLLDGMLLAGDSDETVALVEKVKDEVENSIAAANAAESVADLSEVVNAIKAAVDKQRGDEKAAAIDAMVVEYDGAKNEISDSFKEYIENEIEEAKAAVNEGEYSEYELINKKISAKIAILKQATELLDKAEENGVTVDRLKDAEGLCAGVESAIDIGGVETAVQDAALDMEKEYAIAYLNTLVGEGDSDYVKEVISGDDGAVSAVEAAPSKDQIDSIVADAEAAVAGERFLDENPVLRKEFALTAADDEDSLHSASDAFADLPEAVRDYLDGKAEDTGYSWFESLINDRINKAEFEAEKGDIIDSIKALVREHDGEYVNDVLAQQLEAIEGVNYEPYHDDDGRDGYAEEKSQELKAAYESAKTEIEHAQAQQRAANQAEQYMQELLANNSYEYSDAQKAELQEIVNRIIEEIKDVTSSEQDVQAVLDGLLRDAQKRLDDAPVTSVIKGDISPSDVDADYGDSSNELWGIVTNDSGIGGSVVLVIEKVEQERKEQIDSALKNGNAVAAEGSDIPEDKLLSLIDGKEVKSVIDVYLLRNGEQITEFEGMYVVKILLEKDMRSAKGLQVVYVNEGNIQVYETQIEGNYLVFTTSHFSEFVIIGEPELNLWWLIITLAVILVIELIAIAIVLIKRKKKDGDSEKANAFAFAPMSSLLTVIIPNGAVAACIALGVCIVAAGALLAVLALKKKHTEEEAVPKDESAEEAFEAAPEEVVLDTLPENAAPISEEEEVEEQAREAALSEAAVAVNAVETVDGAEAIASAESADLEIEGDEEETERETVYDPVTHRYIIIKYSKSFLAKLIQSDDETKSYYEELKNEIMSYGVKSRVSWRYESFRYAKTLLIKMQMRGKTLSLCFALSASDYADSKYKVEDFSDVISLEDTPCLYRIKNARRCQYAKDLIADVMKKYGLERGEEQNISYAYELPYESTSALIDRGLIKLLTDEEEKSEARFRPVEARHEVKATEVDEIISDDEAKALVESSVRYADKTKTGIINVDTLSQCFNDGEQVTLKEIKERVAGFNKKITYVKVLARGTLDKALTVEADDYSIEAIKMIVLTGGKVIRTRRKNEE